ncbi:MAG: SRPBCC domain-containing protein [Gallionellaceae bacterium]
MRHQPFIISEKFPVSVEKMFALWTNPDHLSHWFGPAGVKIVRHSMDLRVGGIYHFCLQTPDGQLMWGKWIFREIDAPKRLVWIHSFSDERGGLTRHPLSDTWPLQLVSTVNFQEVDGVTTVTFQWDTHNATEIEQQTFDNAHESMRQGWGGSLAQLSAYVTSLA